MNFLRIYHQQKLEISCNFQVQFGNLHIEWMPKLCFSKMNDTYTQVKNVWGGWPVYIVKCLCSREFKFK